MNYDDFVEFKTVCYKAVVSIKNGGYHIRLSNLAIDLSGFEFDNTGVCKCSVLINPANMMVAIKQSPNGDCSIRKNSNGYVLNNRRLILYLKKMGYTERKKYFAKSPEKGVLIFSMDGDEK